MVIEIPIWCEKGARGEEQLICNIQQTVGMQKSAFQSIVVMQLQFLSSEVTTQLIPTSGILGRDISPWPEIPPPNIVSTDYFLPSFHKFLHKLWTEQPRSSHPSEDPSLGVNKKGIVLLSFTSISYEKEKQIKSLVNKW